MKYDEKFADWLRDHDIMIITRAMCPYSNSLINSLVDPHYFIEIGVLDTSGIRPKGMSKEFTFPIIFHKDKGVVLQEITDSKLKMKKLYEKFDPKNSRFGSSAKLKFEHSGAPRRDWGSFSYDPRCELRKMHHKKRVSFGGLYAHQTEPYGNDSKNVSFGAGVYANQSKPPIDDTNKWYDKRGNNGFQDRPTTIYKSGGGPVQDPGTDPYKNVHTGIIPRPFGPRDNAAMKYAWQESLKANSYGTDYGPNPPKEEWYPHQERTWKGATSSNATEGLYLNKFGSNISNAWQRLRNIKEMLEEHGSDSHIDELIEDIEELLKEKKMNGKKLGMDDIFELNKTFDEIEDYLSTQNMSFGSDYSDSDSESDSDYDSDVFEQEFGNEYPDFNTNVSFQPPMVMYGDPGANTFNRLTNERYLPPLAPGVYPSARNYATPDQRLKVAQNNNPTGWLSDSGVVPVSGTRFGMEEPYPAQPMVVANQDASGITMSGQPLDLYKYQNTDYGTYNYPQFLGPRYWMGGFGSKKKRYSKIKQGDIIEVRNGKINVRKG